MDNVQVRDATLDEIDTLNDIMYRSKASLGYDEAMLSKWFPLCKITEDKMSHSITKVVIFDQNIIGFWMQPATTELMQAAYFIEPSYIGKGFGHVLWDAVISEAKQRSIPYFVLRCDPHARDFYEHMGAELLREEESYYAAGLIMCVFRVNILN